MGYEKEMIKKLIRIADNQQKIINKLAQQLPSTEPAPMHLSPSSLPHLSNEKVVATLKEKLAALGVAGVSLDGSVVTINMAPGKNPDQSFINKLNSVFQELMMSKVLPQGASYQVMS